MNICKFCNKECKDGDCHFSCFLNRFISISSNREN